MHTDLQEKLDVLLALSRKVNAQRDLSPLLDLLAREAAELLEADRASVFLLDREKNELWSKVALGNGQLLRIDAGFGIVGHVVRTGETVNVQDAYGDERVHALLGRRSGYIVQTILVAPIRNAGGEVTGAFVMVNKKQGVFTAEDEELLAALALQAAVAIETARLIEDLRRRQNELLDENSQLWREVEGKFSHAIVGANPKIQNVVRLIDRIRDSSVNVLITGEYGTGKALAARTIHYSSNRARHAFVVLDCAALPDAAVDADLFGGESRPGYFERALGGTLFIDSVGRLSLVAQARILHALEQRVEVRIIAAADEDLDRAVRRASFREDLYNRLNVIHIHMPALREIPEDIRLLAQHFVAAHCRAMARETLDISPEVMHRLIRAEWPGNARQLQSELRRMVACTPGRVITAGVWEAANLEPPALPGAPARLAAPMRNVVEQIEREMIQEALAATRHNQQQAARLLGLSRQGLINKLKRYELKVPPAGPPTVLNA